MLTFLVALHDDPDTDNDYLILHKFLYPLTMLKTGQGNGYNHQKGQEAETEL